MGRPSRYSPETRERAIRMVLEHGPEHLSQWAAIQSIAEKLGCRDETLRRWVRQAERDAGNRPGLTTSERQRLKDLERENRELKRANEILRKASTYSAQAERRALGDSMWTTTVVPTQLARIIHE
jgi:transposase